MACVMTINNKVAEMAELEPFVERISEEFDIAPDVAFQLQLALDEALANSVNYAYPEGTEGKVTLEAEKEGSNITFKLMDEGVEFDPTKGGNVDTTLSAEDRPIGGLGIFLIKQMMNSVTYERKGNTNILTMTKQL